MATTVEEVCDLFCTEVRNNQSIIERVDLHALEIRLCWTHDGKIDVISTRPELRHVPRKEGRR